MKKTDIKRRYNLSNQQGFTLLELMIAVVISLIFISAVYLFFVNQNQSYLTQTNVVDIQQNLRSGVYIMERELRMAGFDPTRSRNFKIKNAKADQISFDVDYDQDGVVDPGESITFALVDTDSDSLKYELTRTGSDAIAYSIENIAFAYAYDADNDGDLDRSAGGNIIWGADTDDDGDWDSFDTNDDNLINSLDSPGGISTGTPFKTDDIRVVRVWLLARSANKEKNFIDSKTYILGSEHVTPGDDIRRRLITTTVKFRNLGL